MSLNLVPAEFEPHAAQIQHALVDFSCGLHTLAAATLTNTISSMIQQSLTRSSSVREAQNSPLTPSIADLLAMYAEHTGESFVVGGSESEKSGSVTAIYTESFNPQRINDDSDDFRSGWQVMTRAIRNMRQEIERLNPDADRERVNSFLASIIVMSAAEFEIGLSVRESE